MLTIAGIVIFDSLIISDKFLSELATYSHMKREKVYKSFNVLCEFDPRNNA